MIRCEVMCMFDFIYKISLILVLVCKSYCIVSCNSVKKWWIAQILMSLLTVVPEVVFLTGMTSSHFKRHMQIIAGESPTLLGCAWLGTTHPIRLVFLWKKFFTAVITTFWNSVHKELGNLTDDEATIYVIPSVIPIADKILP